MAELSTSFKVAGYVRVSTDNQLDNYSLEEQASRIRSYCDAKGWILNKLYRDGGYSGGNINRPALQQMLLDIEAGKIDTIVVYKLDRLSRSQKDTLLLIEDKFIAYQVAFISINENFDTSTPFGRAMIGMLSVFAQLEKDQITERFTMGRIGRAKKGFYHGGPKAPTGYDYINGELIINEYEALQVKEVFRLYLEGNSIHAIKRQMQQKYTNKHGNWSSHTLVTNILHNEVYIGKIKFKDTLYQGLHEPLLAEDTFYEVQNLLKNQRNTKENFPNHTVAPSPFKATNLLTGILYCKKCKAGYFGNHGKYTCYSRAKTNPNKILDKNCKNKNWDIEELNQIIIEEVLALSFGDKNMTPVELSNSAALSLKSLKKRLREINLQSQRLLTLYQVETLAKSELDNRFSALAQAKQALQNELNTLVIKKSPLILNHFAILKEFFQTESLAKKRLFLRSLIDYIDLEDDRIDIHWNF